MTTDDILCRFVEARYGWTDVTRVELDESIDVGTEYTPGDGWSLTLHVYNEEGRCFSSKHIANAIPFVHDITRFAAQLVDNADYRAIKAMGLTQ